MRELADLEAVFITHHHVDHFVGLDRVVRANLDHDKTMHVFGPPGTIRRVTDRVTSYDYPFFPFMKLVLAVHELAAGVVRVGHLACKTKFARPDVTEAAWPGGGPVGTPAGGPAVCYDTEFLQVEAVPVVHTVPCLAYALVEKPGVHPDPAKLAAGGAAPRAVGRPRRCGCCGPVPRRTPRWTSPAAGTPSARWPTRRSARRPVPGSRSSPTPCSPPSYGRTWRQLARGAGRLYCDSFYATAQAKDAARHRHMTAAQAGELAKLAKVECLVPMHFAARYAGKHEVLLAEARAVFGRVAAG